MVLHLISVVLLFFTLGIELPPDEFTPGWVRDGQTQVFIENDLYGHINGGAELFLEFGFEKLIVQTYTQADEEISVECYVMSDETAALGIYLMKKGKESPHADIRVRNSTTTYQALAVRGNIYLQINNFSGKEQHLPAVTDMANFIMDQSPEISSSVTDMIPTEGRIAGSERIIRGRYALQPLYTFGEGDILSLGRSCAAVYGKYNTEDQQPYSLLRIKYPEVSTARQAFEHLRENLDPYINILSKPNQVLIFKDYKNEYGQILFDRRTIEIRFHLNSEPKEK
jgi:hypothetical protein